MKISSKDENGLRIMLCVSKHERLSIAQISKLECITEPNVAKIARLLRQANLLNSVHGPQGGYELGRSSEDISLADIILAVDGSLFAEGYCQKLNGECNECIHITECSIRPLWSHIQKEINKTLRHLSLKDLNNTEEKVISLLK